MLSIKSPLAIAFQQVRKGRPSWSATKAATEARRIVAGKTEAPSHTNHVAGAAFKIGRDSVRWVENPAALGFRLVGFADEIGANSYRWSRPSIDHKGWFLEDDYSSELSRGVVFQVTGRKGRPRFVAGVADPFSDGPAMIALSTFQGDTEESPRDNSGAREAAISADHMAESYAETERDYRRAYAAGARFADLGEIVTGARSEFLQLRREAKAARLKTESPALCKRLARDLQGLLQIIATSREERARLQSGESEGLYFSLRDESHVQAFSEGAGL